MQLGGNGGASRRRFPLVAFEGGLLQPPYSESLLRLARPPLPTGSTRRPAPGRVLTRNVICYAEAAQTVTHYCSGRYNSFRFLENNYTWTSYFRLDSTFHSTLRFSTASSSDSAQKLREQSKVGIWAKFLAPNVELGLEHWQQASGKMESASLTETVHVR